MTNLPDRRRTHQQGASRRWLPVAIAALAAAGALASSTPAAAEQCHIRISASGRFQGEVVDQGGGRYTRFAVTVEYDLSSVSLRQNFDNRTLRHCPRTPGDVDISADSSIDPLMFHFLNELAGSARVDSVSHRFQEVNATTVEFQRATRKLQLDGLGRASVEIAITTAWDAVQAVAPAKFTTTLAIDFAVETAKEIIRGGGGENLQKWLVWKIPSLLSELGLESDEAKRMAKALENYAKGIDRELADKLKPIVITKNGTAGECQITYSATLDLKANRYHVNFDKYCGDREPDVPTANVTTVSLDPGAAGALTAQAVNRLGIAYPLSAATVTGVAAVMADGSAEPAAVIANRTATFNFTAAKPRKDGDYPVTITLTTFDGKTARWDGKVSVNNVGPRFTAVKPGLVRGDPGATMEIADGTVTVVDDNADKNNGAEVKARDLKLGPHPADLEMTRTNAFGSVDGTPAQKSFDATTGTYIFTFKRNGGKVKKPQMHKTVTTDLTISDDNGVSATASVLFEVNDVAPRFSNIQLRPQFVHRNTPPATINLSGRITDDNGADDIDLPTSGADVSKASSGAVTKLIVGQELAVKGAPGDDYLDFEGTFPQTNEVGTHTIDLVGHDKSGGGHPDGANTADADVDLHVGNAKPVINPWGYIYDTELGGTPEPSQRDGLCPGQPFLAGAIVKDPENDALVVWATIKETGARVDLTLAPGDKTHKGTLHAPATPGDYTLLFDAKERDLTEKADTKASPLTVVPCATDGIDDLSWGSSLDPSTVCASDPFTAEGFVTYFYEDKTQATLYPTGTITFLGATQNVGPASPKASFTAPANPGAYPVTIVIDIAGTAHTMTPQLTVDPCGLASGEDLIEPGSETAGLVGGDPVSEAADLVSDGFDILSHPELFNPVSGERDQSVQLMILDIVGAPEEPLRLGSHLPKSRGRASFAAGADAFWPAAPGVMAYAHAFGGASTRAGGVQAVTASAQGVSAYITSLGTSYGEAFELRMLNAGAAPVNLIGQGVVVEPLKDKARDELQKQLGRQIDRLGKNPVTTRVDAYCLEFLRLPPTAGTVFRIASREVQEKFQPMRYVLTASRRLQELSSFTPDTEPAEYFHSIRQWAIWSKEQGFVDATTFGKAFVEKTKSNFEAAGQPWTREIEGIVEGLVENRWKDVESVLEGAAALAARDGIAF